jgi:hypothetical protein
VRPSSPRAIEDQTALHFVAVSEPVVPEAGREAWWDSQECFAAYMRSEDHHRSHQRIPKGEHRPRLRQFRRYKVIAR